MVRRMLALALACAVLPVLGSRCAGGDGSGGGPPLRIMRATDCAPLVGAFPPGFDWLPGSSGHAVGVQNTPPAALFFDMNGDKPELLATGTLNTIPPDSDGDGNVDEDQRLCGADTSSAFFEPGDPLGVSEQLALLAGSGYEQAILSRAPAGALTEMTVTNPPDTAGGSYHGEDYPYLPQGSDARTAITTKACIYLTDGSATTSIGNAVGTHPCCDRISGPGISSFFTAYTAGMTFAAGHLFVATSNLDLPNRYLGSYFPGTVLVYDFDPLSTPPTIQPNTSTPVILTTGFNPTGVSLYRTPRGRELVLVTNSGALTPYVGRANILTESFIDIIDAASRKHVATVPMGLAGLSFEGVAIDPAQRVAMIGSWTLREIYAIDLRVFDDETLYEQDELIWLDGTDAEFPDARIFDADTPLEIPDRADGPHPIVCEGEPFVAINDAGDSAYVLERCDGTLTHVHLLDAGASCEQAGNTDACCDRVPLPPSCFSLGSTQNLTDPYHSPSSDRLGPSQVRVRPGEPGIDYSGPDIFYTIDRPDALLCPLRIDSF